MRRAGVVALLTVGLLFGGSGLAAAGEQWCETDPLVVIKTPSGALVSLYVTNGAAGLEHLALAQLADIRYSVGPVEGGTATLVRMTVTIPLGLDGQRFDTSSVVSTGPLKTGTVLASTRGTSGQAMRLEFKLDTP